MTVYFAWVDASETTFDPSHERVDENVLTLRIAQQEGDFAWATVEVKNPRAGLLAAGRKQWAWIAYDDGGSAGSQPLFFGRLFGLPARLAADTVRLELRARPADFAARKQAAADALKVAPFWDPVWIAPDARDDPDAVLEARNAVWHIDRTSHAVTASDFNVGEAGTVDLGASPFYDSVSLAPLQPPARRIRVAATAHWDQAGAGTVDLRAALIAAFRAAGSQAAHAIETYTGEGLEQDWPDPGAVIGAGWRVRDSKVERGEGVWVDQVFNPVGLPGGTVNFPLWTFRPTLTVAWEAQRSRTETLVFELEADTQAVQTDPGDAEVERLDLSAADIAEAIDDLGTAGFAAPMGDVRRNTYFGTDRGKTSAAHLLARARAKLLARARAAEIRVETAWADALAVTCRHNIRVADPRLPGGAATGKVAAYALSINGDTGEFKAEIIIGCTVGQGGSVSAAAGTPDYVQDGYVADGWQTRSGAVVVPIAAEVGYTDFDDQGPPNDGAADDGVNLLAMTPANVVLSLQVFDGPAAQKAVLDAAAGSGSLSVAADALNQAFTEVDLSLVPLDTGPFAHEIAVSVTDLKIAKTIDLEAA